ncbi:hypothetical protein MHB46_22485 [Paenibacillus sp. FSL H7-0703]|uniref:hypothetical protein n=1 Tax=Paenibacillus sp. FSL H7-0703 TaxID=2921438 RepID=UPI0030FAC949
MKKEKAIPHLTPFVANNIQRYSEVYTNLGYIIKNAKLPEDAGVGPLFCILPNSEEFSSELDAKDRLSDNAVLKNYISSTLQYTINLQGLLIHKMANKYVKRNLDKISRAVNKLCVVENVVPHIKYLDGTPLCRPYIKKPKL